MATFKLLAHSHAEKSSKGCWNPKELDGDLGSSWSEHIASQPFFPRESVASPLAPRERERVCFWLSLEGLFQLHVNSLNAHELHAFPSMPPSTPVTPEERLTPDDKWMQQDADLARLVRFAAIPLTLLTQWARAATAHAGRIHHTQAPISFSTPLLGNQLLPCWAAQRPIGLERKILTRKVPCFPGGGRGGWAIPSRGNG
jgi:hypothetical protein